MPSQVSIPNLPSGSYVDALAPLIAKVGSLGSVLTELVVATAQGDSSAADDATSKLFPNGTMPPNAGAIGAAVDALKNGWNSAKLAEDAMNNNLNGLRGNVANLQADNNAKQNQITQLKKDLIAQKLQLDAANAKIAQLTGQPTGGTTPSDNVPGGLPPQPPVTAPATTNPLVWAVAALAAGGVVAWIMMTSKHAENHPYQHQLSGK